ncbi:MAG: dTDP-glucose 4,6-dehydratase [Phycisphaerae bacterium]
MRSVLVTGGAGFIGCNFVRHLLDADPNVRIVDLDLLTYAGSRENLRDLPDADRHSFVRGDIADRPLIDRLLREHDVDTIVHLAAESHVDRSIAAPGRFIETNIVGTFTLLEAARGAWLAADRPVRFHHVSTDEVFGSLAPDDPSFHERTPYDPRSPYAASKAASDHLVRAYAHTYGLPVTISNCTNNYGPYQFPEKLIPLMILNALEGRALPVYGDGRQVRDWLYVRDHCDALLRILRTGRPGETYGVGGDNQPTNLEIVTQLCAVLDELRPDSPHRPHFELVRFVADRPGHDRRYAMDTTKIRAELGWSPRHTLDAGLRQTVAWYLEHAEWLAAIRGQPGYDAWMQQNYATRG